MWFQVTHILVDNTGKPEGGGEGFFAKISGKPEWGGEGFFCKNIFYGEISYGEHT